MGEEREQERVSESESQKESQRERKQEWDFFPLQFGHAGLIFGST